MSTNNTTNNVGTEGGGGPGSGSSSGSNIEVEYNEIVSRRGWPIVFQDIRERSDVQARSKKFSTDESKKLDNRRLNRYRDVLPYDHSRVVLKRGENDYINANLVKMDRAGRKYILCQGPLPHTVGHFWMMVWEHDSRAILMLNKLIEQTTVKCHQYWPSKIGEKHRLEVPGVQLSVVHLKCVEYKNFCKRTFRLTDMESGKSREVIQFHYTTWPDFGIPSSPVAFLQFLKEVRDSGTLDRDVGPPIIHCSAGIGRSGTFCLVDCCLVLVDKEGEDRVSVQDVLLELRQFRMGLIQTPDQLYFSYQAIIEGMKRMNNSSFEEFEELMIVSSSSQQNSDQETEENEDTPPPLPPPRSHSLSSKPLPLIPTSASVHEDFLHDSSNGGGADRDKVNNLVNLEKNKQFEMSDDNHHHHHHHNNHHHKRSGDGNSHSGSNHHYHPYSNRPLPPVVRDSSLYKLNESDSDGVVDVGSSSGSDSNAMSSEDELIEENDSDIGEEEEVENRGQDVAMLKAMNRDGHGRDVPSDNSDNIKSSLLDDTTSSSSNTTTTTNTTGTTSTTSSSTTTIGGSSTGISSSTSVSTTSSTTGSAVGSNNSTLESKRGDSKATSDQHHHQTFNANSSLPPLPNGELEDDGDEVISSPERELSPGAELRRRKRIERQSAMEEKIREIKRKRKEVESKGSPKKRRKQKESEK
uniref:protein-tyrosine-phosphatase n=1 Tax=Anopheles farauti TaxID=69004 RepID=A0A499FUK3_9DIPT